MDTVPESARRQSNSATQRMSQAETQPQGAIPPISAPPAKEAFEWAQAAMRQKDWQAATQRWAALRQLYPDRAAPWIRGGIATLRLEQYKQAQTLLAEARQRFPGNPNAWVQGAEAAYADACTSEAEILLAQARDDFPETLEVWTASAEMARRVGNMETAWQYNDHARRHFSGEPDGFIQCAELAMASENWEAAKAYWNDVRAQFPKQRSGYIRGADVLEILGDARGARRLRLARKYGNDWLESAQNGENDQNHVKPAARRDVFSFIDLVWTKARFNLKSEASRDRLRYLWWVLEPLLFMSVYYVVFEILLSRGGANYIPYLLTGVMPFQWFAKTIQQTSGSILQGQSLMNQVRISPLFFPLVRVIQNAGKQSFVFLILAILLILSGFPPSIYWVAVVPVIVLQFLFQAVVGCTLAMLIPFIRDLTNLIPVGIRFMLFSSGVFYTLNIIPEQWRGLFLINPMANLLHQYRLILVEQQWPDWSQTGWLALACVLAGLLVYQIYRHLEGVYPRVVLE